MRPWTAESNLKAQELIWQCVDLERKLHDLGLVLTARKMNQVTERIGWEMADKLEKAGMISDSEKRRRRHHDERGEPPPKPRRRRSKEKTVG